MITTRTTLRIVVVLGVLVTLVGGTGIFAVFTDRATTGSNDVTTGALASAADLKIATAGPHDPQTNPPFDCGTYVDDLATGLFSFTQTSPGQADESQVCLRNDGTAYVAVAMSAIDLVDTDLACTGDEAGFGDTTCGNDGAGELSGSLAVDVETYDCGQGVPLNTGVSSTVAALASAPQSLTTLPGGGSICLVIRVGSTATGTDAQVVQSDRSVWRFAFDGTVPGN